MNHIYPKYVQITEVAPRDGLQSETKLLETSDKINFINELSACGFSNIEFSSFVDQKIIPNLADAESVFESIDLNSNCRYSALVANEKGFFRALKCGVKNIALVTSASDQFCKKNINCSTQESLNRIAVITKQAKLENIHIRIYISCAFDCAYEGKIDPKKVIDLITEINDLDCDEISLADTTGKASPRQVEILINKCLNIISADKIIMHFHNSYNLALVNVLLCLQLGLFRFDTSVAGIGGCNFSPRSTGNLATEDLLYMLHNMGINTGIDIEKVILSGDKIASLLGHENGSFIAHVV